MARNVHCIVASFYFSVRETLVFSGPASLSFPNDYEQSKKNYLL